jgi:hypothetical protein
VVIEFALGLLLVPLSVRQLPKLLQHRSWTDRYTECLPPFSTSPVNESSNGIISPRIHSFPSSSMWKQGFYPPMTINTPMRDVLGYMFAAPDHPRVVRIELSKICG